MAIASLATATVLAVALGACAGSEADAAKNAYVRALNATQERFARTATEVSGAITATSSVRQERRTLVRYGAVVGDLVRALHEVAVPAEVRGEHAGLVAAMVEFRREVSTAVNDLRSPTMRAIDDTRRRLAGATRILNAKLAAATVAINGKLQSG